MARSNGTRILPFRIPMFRIFYSATYTALYFLCLLALAITPISMLWSAIQKKAYQYCFMLGGLYVLTAIIAICIYSNRLYTNRSALAAVGKAHIPIEEGEVGRLVRKMIVKQLQRSAIVAWEGRPRDLYGEILDAERDGVLPAETRSVSHNDYSVGREIPVDPQCPPWGDIQHDGWSSPSHGDGNKYPNVRFADVIQELPHLIEAQAVSLAPPDPRATPVHGEAPGPDAGTVQVLQRPANMALRDYMAQLSYLGVFQPPEMASLFLSQYERARFSAQPVTRKDFGRLMTIFSDLIAGMIAPNSAIVEAIQAVSVERMSSVNAGNTGAIDLGEQAGSAFRTPSSGMSSSSSSLTSPVTAREAHSRSVTPFLAQATRSEESVGSVIHRSIEPELPGSSELEQTTSLDAPSFLSIPSDAGSVLHYRPGYAGS